MATTLSRSIAQGSRADSRPRRRATRARADARPSGAGATARRSEIHDHRADHAILVRARLARALEAAPRRAQRERRAAEAPAQAEPEDPGARLGHAALLLL